MGTVKKAVYKVDNGSDFDEIHFKTDSEQVYMTDGKTIQNCIDNLPIPKPNLIRNSAFEYGDWGFSSGWYASKTAGAGIHTWDYSGLNPHTGGTPNRCVKITGQGPDFRGSVHTESGLGGGALKVKPSTKYVLSAYVKLTGADGAYLQFKELTSNQGIVVTDVKSEVASGTTPDWVRISVTFTTAGLGGLYPVVYLCLDGNGTVAFDNVKLEESKLSPWSNSFAEMAYIDIVETGENSNGKYIKFANGIMLCFGTRNFPSVSINNALGSLFYATGAATNLGSYPATFVNDSISVSLNASTTTNLTVWIGTTSRTTASALPGINLIRHISTTGLNVTIEYIAIGRWY